VTIRVALTLEQCWHPVPGGTAVAALRLTRELASRADVSPVGVSAKHRAPPPPVWRPTIPVRALPLPRAVLYEAWHRLRRPRVERATGPVDVIHATGLAMPPRSAPLVVTLHDLAFVDHPEHFSRMGRRFFQSALAIAQGEADIVLCSSLATLERCAEVGFERSRLRHVPLGVDVEPASATDVERVRTAYALDGRYVLWVGTVEPRKNLPTLLRAFAAVDDDALLVLVGPQGWNEELGERLAELPEAVRERVRVLGFVPQGDLGPLYAGAAAFCFPSLLEGFGFPVVEAMAQGTPVVTSLGTSTEELAGDAGLLVDPRDADALADALGRVLGDEALAARLGELGRARAALYTWQRSADLVLEAYREASARS
jgi:glycosyltransferase involved in cell wall biosynthesis